MKRRYIAVIVTGTVLGMLLTGCSYTETESEADEALRLTVDKKYELCVTNGGSFEYSGVTGSFACIMEGEIVE